MYKFVIKYLQHILNQNLYENTSENRSLDRQTKVPAQWLLASMTFFCFGNIYVYKVCPRCNKAFDSQTSEERYGHFIASKLVEEHVDRIKEIRSAKDTEFESCFEDAKQIADDLNIVIKTPRVCSKQQHRENIYK